MKKGVRTFEHQQQELNVQLGKALDKNLEEVGQNLRGDDLEVVEVREDDDQVRALLSDRSLLRLGQLLLGLLVEPKELFHHRLDKVGTYEVIIFILFVLDSKRGSRKKAWKEIKTSKHELTNFGANRAVQGGEKRRVD